VRARVNAARAIASLAGIQMPKPIPYFAAYQPSGQIKALPKDLTGGLEGLVLAHLVIMNDGSSRVFTYWGTRAHFDVNGEILRERLQAQLLPDRGTVGAVSGPPQPWWKKINLPAFVLALPALWGTAELIGNHYDWLFAEPLLLVRPEKSKVEIIESSDMRMTVTLVNQLPRTEHRNIKVAAELIDNKDKKSYPLQLVEHDIAALPGGATKDLVIEGTAPPVGEYAFHVDATAKAGRLPSSKTFRGEARFIIWPKTPRGSIHLLETKPPWAHFKGTIAVGPAAPQGLDCELQSQGTPELKFDNQFNSIDVGSSNLKWYTAGQLENAVSILTWSTGPVESMRSVTVEFILNREPATDWKAVTEKIKINCNMRQEKLDEPKD
jgi:hypothetical protein